MAQLDELLGSQGHILGRGVRAFCMNFKLEFFQRTICSNFTQTETNYVAVGWAQKPFKKGGSIS